MEAIYRVIRRFPPLIVFLSEIALLFLAWYLHKSIILAALFLWLALEAGSRGLHLRVWALLFLMAFVLMLPEAYFPDPTPHHPPYHPSTPV